MLTTRGSKTPGQLKESMFKKQLASFGKRGRLSSHCGDDIRPLRRRTSVKHKPNPLGLGAMTMMLPCKSIANGKETLGDDTIS